MHVDTGVRTYRAADGTVHEYRQALLRRSYRNAQGKPTKETLANLSMLPERTVDVLRKSLAGKTLVEADAAFEIDRAVAHGHVAAVHKMAYQLKLNELLGPRHRKRDLAYALIVGRIVAPQCVLSTIRWWADTSLCADLDITAAHADEVYAAMDWLVSRQDRIERKLAERHLVSGGMGLCTLSNTWLELGRSRGDERGLPHVEFGVLGDAEGRPVAVRVLAGNIGDARSFSDAISVVRHRFGLRNLIMTGGPAMISSARVEELRTWQDVDWITELRAPAVTALAGPDGPLPQSLSGTRNIAEITDHAFPGERLVCWCDPDLADEHARMRATLLQATEQDRNAERIAAESAVDGIRVLRTNVDVAMLRAGAVVDTYLNLAHIEREFGPIRSGDLDPRRTDRVRAHLLLGMLAAYLNWHLRRALAPLTATDASISRQTRDGVREPEYDYSALIAHLGQLTRNTVTFAGQRFAKIATPTPVQRRAFELLDTPNPPPWTGDG
jgi:hypothetical protein